MKPADSTHHNPLVSTTPSVTDYFVNVQVGGNATDLHLHVGGNGPPPARFWTRLRNAIASRLLGLIGPESG